MRSTKLNKTLESVSNIEEEIQLVADNLQTCSEDQLKKRKWSLQLYNYFCDKGNIEPIPITGKKVACFIHFLGVSEYSLSSIKNFIVPSLKEHFVEETGQGFLKIDQKFITEAYRVLRNNPDYIQENQSFQPCILEDVGYMISTTPDGYSKKALYSSLFLFSVSCGARAISCESITLGSIKNVELNYETKLAQVDICIPSTKGNKFKWNHLVKLEGHIAKGSPTNFFYWFNFLLKEKHNLDLYEFKFWTLDEFQKKKSLWGMNTDSMRTAIKSVSAKCGYPSDLFCFHSLRSGFLSSIVLKSLGNENLLRSSIETSALVGGWKAGSNPHLKYFKSALTKEIICSRLVDTHLPNEMVNNSRTIESFHNIKLSLPNWSESTNFEKFQTQISTYIEEKISLFSNDSNNIGTQFVWNKFWERLVFQIDLLKREYEMIEVDLKGKNMKKLSGCFYIKCIQKLGRDYIVNELLNNFSILNELVETSKEIIDSVINDYTTRTQKQLKRKIVLFKYNAEQDRSKSKNYWTDDEVQCMLRLYCNKKGNEEIARELRPRTGTDVKDKMKNLKKKFETFENILENYCPGESLKEPTFRNYTKSVAIILE